MPVYHGLSAEDLRFALDLAVLTHVSEALDTSDLEGQGTLGGDLEPGLRSPVHLEEQSEGSRMLSETRLICAPRGHACPRDRSRFTGALAAWRRTQTSGRVKRGARDEDSARCHKVWLHAGAGYFHEVCPCPYEGPTEPVGSRFVDQRFVLTKCAGTSTLWVLALVFPAGPLLRSLPGHRS
jgi:hypothetical protein